MRTADLPNVIKMTAKLRSQIRYLALASDSRPMLKPEQMLADAIKRGTARKAELLREAGGLLTAQEAARLLGTTARALSARQSLIAVQMDNGNIGFPAFQFENESILLGVAAVLDAINVDDPWMRLNCFFMHLDELNGRRPIDFIRDGSIKAVVLAARHYGDHGAS